MSTATATARYAPTSPAEFSVIGNQSAGVAGQVRSEVGMKASAAMHDGMNSGVNEMPSMDDFADLLDRFQTLTWQTVVPIATVIVTFAVLLLVGGQWLASGI
jgi:hypothetical protein